MSSFQFDSVHQELAKILDISVDKIKFNDAMLRLEINLTINTVVWYYPYRNVIECGSEKRAGNLNALIKYTQRRIQMIEERKQRKAKGTKS